jgi:hypothetical protein
VPVQSELERVQKSKRHNSSIEVFVPSQIKYFSPEGMNRRSGSLLGKCVENCAFDIHPLFLLVGEIFCRTFKGRKIYNKIFMILLFSHSCYSFRLDTSLS